MSLHPSGPLQNLDDLPIIETPFIDKTQHSLNIPSTTLSNKHSKIVNIPINEITNDIPL